MWIRGRGDAGYSSLLSGERVPKYDDHPETYGTVDEATSFLGFARTLTQNEEVARIAYEVQEDLHLLMSDLASAGPAGPVRIGKEDVDKLDRYIDDLLTRMQLPNDFVIPGATQASAAMDMARAVVRRAERSAARLLHNGELRSEQTYRYLNRLSSLLYTLARYEEASCGVPYALVHHREPRREEAA